MIGAKPHDPLQFFVAARRDDHAGPVQLGELQREKGHAAGSLYDDDIAGFHPAFGDDRLPGGDSGAGKRGGIRVRQMLRHADQAVFMQDSIFGQ